MNWLKIGAVVAVALVIAGAYVAGRKSGENALLARLAADRVEIIKDGEKIDAEALSADDDALCRLLGGCRVPDESAD